MLDTASVPQSVTRGLTDTDGDLASLDVQDECVYVCMSVCACA